ncbi:hypothetical protein OG259_07890 [Streptomyces sp. NBC_00250]|uniref:hypothetical protein n=1 Tax=Streptomyces sp. NBC_00250 TaxID=2903641 RepID=UPI002E2AF46B|nr:hypothetical protein [Streptomyces sp. NBC_00250]
MSTNPKLINAAADVIQASMARGNREAYSLAFDLNAAGLLQAPESEPLAWAKELDAKSLDNFLTTLGLATEHEPLDEAIDQIHELIRSFREAVEGGAR